MNIPLMIAVALAAIVEVEIGTPIVFKLLLAGLAGVMAFGGLSFFLAGGPGESDEHKEIRQALGWKIFSALCIYGIVYFGFYRLTGVM
jgi:hypothetical protein